MLYVKLINTVPYSHDVNEPDTIEVADDFDFSKRYNLVHGGLVEITPPAPPVRTLEQAKQEKKNEIARADEEANRSVPITFGGQTLHLPLITGNKTHLDALGAQSLYGSLPNNTQIQFRFFASDGVFEFTTAGQWKQFFTLLATAYGTTADKRASKNNAVNNATTIAEVDAISWS